MAVILIASQLFEADNHASTRTVGHVRLFPNSAIRHSQFGVTQVRIQRQKKGAPAKGMRLVGVMSSLHAGTIAVPYV